MLFLLGMPHSNDIDNHIFLYLENFEYFDYFEYFEGSHLQISELKGCGRDRNNIRGLLWGRLRFGAVSLRWKLSSTSTGGKFIKIS